METIEHKIFLKKNNIDISLLFEPIQDKIKIFDRMYDKLEKASVCSRSDFRSELEKLDLEIMEDITEVYADSLSNNLIKDTQKEQKKDTDIKQSDVLKPSIKNDEIIIENLVKSGKVKNIGRSTFLDLGLQTKLEWLTIIGKYRVKRINVFTYRYDIYLNND